MSWQVPHPPPGISTVLPRRPPLLLAYAQILIMNRYGHVKYYFGHKITFTDSFDHVHRLFQRFLGKYRKSPIPSIENRRRSLVDARFP